MPARAADMKDLVSLCKRRGFVFAASDIYGGLNGFWDYGPLGIGLKNNLRDRWWKDMVVTPPIGPDGEPVDIVGVDSSIIQNPKTWVASGHVAGFTDPMVDCRETKLRYRADHLIVVTFGDGPAYAFDKEADLETIHKRIKKLGEKSDPATAKRVSINDVPLARIYGPDAKEIGTLTEPRAFNLMFETRIGALATSDSLAYLRPETAQGIFLNFKNVVDSSRVRVPFGIAQIGKAFRNEVTPRNFIYRSREFEQMEMEWFCHPDEAAKWFEFWVDTRHKWWQSVGIPADSLKIRPHDRDELSHYAKLGEGTKDIEFRFPFTDPDFGELEGIAHRTDFDLKAHQEHSGVKMEYLDQVTNTRFFPHVIEPASGLTRGVLAVLVEAYTKDENRPSGLYLNFHPAMAPIKAAILPLTAKDGQPEFATKLYMDLREQFAVELDIKQNIGKRYARQDEIGTPFCVTVDDQSLKDNTVTVRHRNTMAQDRISVDKLEAYLREQIKNWKV